MGTADAASAAGPAAAAPRYRPRRMAPRTTPLPAAFLHAYHAAVNQLAWDLDDVPTLAELCSLAHDTALGTVLALGHQLAAPAPPPDAPTPPSSDDGYPSDDYHVYDFMFGEDGFDGAEDEFDFD